ncbi:hypothetical protein [Arthrobacter sp. 35W]|uniref:hypothetical protein n=1 Tax=Arthrobacter sp. 35W TaxID=1132441 RepID=UPI00040A581B|nr:hypothetical protein [Arthrobacter sp. 35W]
MGSGRRWRALLLWLLVLAGVLGLIVAGGIWAVSFFKPFAAPLAQGCRAAADGTEYSLALDQTENAALITAVSVRRGMPARAASIGLATAIQESKLRNITHGDLDSLGLFQQRPSQGWGTEEQILDRFHSTNAFFDVLATVPGYEDMPITEAAQIVQRSAYPDAYAQREPTGKAFASALTGHSPAALSCTLTAPDGTGSPAAVADALDAAYGSVPSQIDGALLSVAASETAGWSYAQWAVANAQSLAITEVSFAGQRWVRGNNDGSRNAGWHSTGAEPGPVVITVAQP